MHGVMTFRSVSEALRAGYHVYDRTDTGYLVRTNTNSSFSIRAKLTCCSRTPSGSPSELTTEPSGDEPCRILSLQAMRHQIQRRLRS